MNKKQRKLAFEKLQKTAFVDTTVDTMLSQIDNDSNLQAIQDPNEYAHQVFQKMLAQISANIKNSIK